MPKNSKDNSWLRFNEVKSIFEDYIEAVNKNKIMSSFLKDKEALEFSSKIDGILQELSYPYPTILKKVFIEKALYGWWEDFYGKSRFYQLRRLAIDSFLSAYHALNV